MMPIKFIKQSRKNINRFLFLTVCILLIYFICTLMFYSCNNNKKGVSLQQFNIKSTQLDSVIQSFVDSIKKIKELSNDIPIMALQSIDSFPAFYFTIVEKEDISHYYISELNTRIVGYIKTKSKDIIVLTKESDKMYFVMKYYKFLIPTYHTKKFDFIYFPDNMYCVPDEKGIPCPPFHFEPDYRVFIYKNDMFELYSAYSK